MRSLFDLFGIGKACSRSTRQTAVDEMRIWRKRSEVNGQPGLSSAIVRNVRCVVAPEDMAKASLGGTDIIAKGTGRGKQVVGSPVKKLYMKTTLCFMRGLKHRCATLGENPTTSKTVYSRSTKEGVLKKRTPGRSPRGCLGYS